MKEHPGIRSWIQEHDERWSFIVPYVVLSISLSVFISLFWLAAVIFMHAFIEWMRNAPRPLSSRFIHTAGRLQLDFALLAAALAVDVYFELTMGMAGAAQSVRAAATVATRSPAWAHVLKAVVIGADDALHLLRLRKGHGGKTAQASGEALRVERIPAVLGTLALVLLMAAPFILGTDLSDTVSAVGAAFQPW